MPESTVVTTSHRRLLPTAILTITAITLAGACTQDTNEPEPPPPTTPAAPTTPTHTCGTTAPDGTTIDVVESGFTMVDNPNDRPEASYGTLLENTSSTYVAVLTLVVIHLTDADGTSADNPLRDPPRPPAQAVQTIFPGQRLGIGDQVRLDRDNIQEISVEVGETLWLPTDQVRHLGEATASNIDFQRPGTRSARIAFHVDPTVDPRQHGDSSVSISDAQSWAVFRNGEGTIVGGGNGPPGTSWNGMNDTGPIIGNVQVSRVPDGTVDQHTEIYISPVHPAHRDRPC